MFGCDVGGVRVGELLDVGGWKEECLEKMGLDMLKLI